MATAMTRFFTLTIISLLMTTVLAVMSVIGLGRMTEGYTVLYQNSVGDEAWITFHNTLTGRQTKLPHVSRLRTSIDRQILTYREVGTSALHLFPIHLERFFQQSIPSDLNVMQIYSISPDFRYLLYSDQSSELLSYDTQSGQVIAVEQPYNVNVFVDTVVWLPDNQRFLMLSVDRGGSSNYYVLSAAEVTTPVVHSSTWTLQPFRTIVVLPFASDDRSLNFDGESVFIRDTDNVQIPIVETVNLWDLAVSPTGEQVALLMADADSRFYQLRVYDIATATLSTVLNIGEALDGAGSPFFVAYSPDGQQLMTTITTGDTECSYANVTLNTDGSNVQPIFSECNVRRILYYLP